MQKNKYKNENFFFLFLIFPIFFPIHGKYIWIYNHFHFFVQNNGVTTYVRAPMVQTNNKIKYNEKFKKKKHNK